jgi:hypothetical protein
MRRLMMLLVLVLAAVPAFPALPSFGREIAVSAPETAEPRTTKRASSIASNGEGYLAGWTDFRIYGEGRVYAERLSAEGQLLDRTSLFLGEGIDPLVVWSGQQYVVAWWGNSGLFAVTVSAEGVAGTARVIYTPQAAGRSINGTAIASNGKTILIASEVALLLDQYLNIVRHHPAPAQASGSGGTAIATIGDEYLIAMANNTGAGSIVTFTIDAAGNAGPTHQVPGTNGAGMIDVASNGSSYFLVWTAAALRGRELSRENQETGQVRDLAVRDSSIPAGDRGLYSPRVVWRNGEYLLTYANGSAYGQDPGVPVKALRVSAAGTAIGVPSPSFGRSYYAEEAALAIRSGGSGAAIWIDNGESLRVGLFDDASIAAAAPFSKVVRPAIAAREQLRPALERVDGTAVVAWIERDSAGSDVRIAPLGGTPQVVATPDNPVWTDVQYDGETVWVVWADRTSLGVRRYTRALEPIDAEAFLVPRPKVDFATPESAEAAEGSLIVTWQVARAGDTDIVAQVIRRMANQLTLAADVALTPPEDFRVDSQSVAVWNGHDFLVAFISSEDFLYGDPPLFGPADIRATRVSKQGVVLDAVPFSVCGCGGDRVTSLAAGARADGSVVMAWQLSDATTLAAPFEGDRLVTPHLLARPNPSFVLGAAVLLDDGGLDVYWRAYVSPIVRSTIRQERFDAAYSTLGTVSIDPFVSTEAEVRFDATAIGTAPILAYSRLADGPAYGGIGRVFARIAAPARWRVVR